MIEALTWIAIKSFFKKSFELCKKYWQIIVGFIGGVLLFVIARDRDALKILKKTTEINREERDRSLEIDQEENNKIAAAVDEYHKKSEDALKSLNEKESDLSDKKDEIKESLLEKEKEERGTIARELENEIDKFN